MSFLNDFPKADREAGATYPRRRLIMVNDKKPKGKTEPITLCTVNLPLVPSTELPAPTITTAKYQANAESAATLLAHNCSISETAAKIGINRNTLYSWMNTDHFQMLFELKKADRRLKIERKIEEAAEGKNWTAGAWLLERGRVFKGDYDPPAIRNKVDIDITSKLFVQFTKDQIIELLEET